ncbi:MAG: OmpA family protein [Rhodospirillales bacterium]|jgi:OOP family OmpA-OmpF porin|nr:OmpA family protein [Rhodospirillales bacterium]
MQKPLYGPVRITGLVALGFLAGCGGTFDYDALRAANADGDGFAPALSREYKSFALFETDEMMDWPDAAHFGGKTLQAARGSVPQPEDLGDRRLPAEHVGELAAARARLVQALDRGAGRRWPDQAAVAQVSFDCWVEQQEENWQHNHIALCRDRFRDAMATIDQRFASADAPIDLQPASAEQGEMPGGGATRRFVVPFEFDSAELNGGAESTVEAVARVTTAGGDMRVAIGGHADRAGTHSYNERLSLRRAEALSRALIAKGVPAERITVGAFGERRPVVPTGDGVPDRRNRRVEVTVGPAPDL